MFARQSAQPKVESSVVTRSVVDGNPGVFRFLQTRTESAGRESVTETIQAAALDSYLTTIQVTTIETVHVGADTLQSRRDEFGADLNGNRRLIQSTESEEATASDGSSRLRESSWTPDVNGRLYLSGRRVQEVKPEGSNVKQTDTSIFRPGINEPMLETERFREVERQVSADITRSESSRFVRDVNGRWMAAETRNQEVRMGAGGDRTEEEVVYRLDITGNLAPSERNVTRRYVENGREQLITETYYQDIGAGYSSPLMVNRRVVSTTVTMPDGGRQTTSELEAPNPTTAGQPLRVVQRSVETVRPIGPDRWEIQRQVLALDGNGRLAPFMVESGETTGK